MSRRVLLSALLSAAPALAVGDGPRTPPEPPPEVIAKDLLPLWQEIQGGLLRGEPDPADALDLAGALVPRLDFANAVELPDGSLRVRFPGGGPRDGLRVTPAAEERTLWSLRVHGPAPAELAAPDVEVEGAELELQVACRDGRLEWVAWFAQARVHHTEALAKRLRRSGSLTLGGHARVDDGRLVWKPIELLLEAPEAPGELESWLTRVGQPELIREGAGPEVSSALELVSVTTTQGGRFR